MIKYGKTGWKDDLNRKVSALSRFFCALIMTVSSIAWAARPDESIIKSCLLGRSVAPSVAIKMLNSNERYMGDEYTRRYDAFIVLQYHGADFGYAENDVDHVLIYRGKRYRISKAIPLDKDSIIGPADVGMVSSILSFAKKGSSRYFCFGFNTFPSGSFQYIHSGFFIDVKTGQLYSAVRYYPGEY